MSAHSPIDQIEQPDSFAFDAESEEQIAAILAKYPPERKASGTLPLLYVVQKQMGRQTGSAWVPRVAMDEVAHRLEVAPIRVYEVATFYLMFNTKPIGRYHLQVCTTTSCWLRGSDDVVAACKKATGIDGFGQSSADGLFTLTEVECLGACANAPILQVDDDFYEDLDGPRTIELIEALRRGERPTPGPTIDRVNSAPAGGRRTLADSPAEQG
ncbi:NADH dehydrogenase [Gluconacetobacter liquefaciens]|uniref:NAD(P)H-dependent oxidoreductase subunit E n=1 Tax=Gluconacetobacter liquefaciens TaxID=89584 RepID=A0A370G5T3_GLULI|nr:NAD(P)H-dependent oxidoreductase subunit E [Gluconacetobacter liquefaciens]MBB2186532.1 NAD(P)H-dependent oxidoreductase subunit E [Gluconacetobacter liquefaciens]RDI38199.1 NADH dehydrogenase subunit E [Gluconacetobacter liquefaciens]GEB36745.1 NADH dehydrogenase [Gluconacetobacter liquefaciens]